MPRNRPANIHPAQHARWNGGGFEIISGDNVAFKVDPSLLESNRLVSHWIPSLTYSSVLSDMLVAGSGPMRIHLDESAKTIEQFLDLAASGNFDLPMENIDGSSAAIIRVSRISRFLHKYDCPPVRGRLCSSVANRVERRELPPITLLISEIPEKPVQFASMLDRYSKRETSLWPRPDSTRSQGERAMKPTNVPIEAYAALPVQYHWALKMSNVGNLNPVDVLDDGSRGMKPGQRFLHFLGLAEAAGFCE